MVKYATLGNACLDYIDLIRDDKLLSQV